MKKRYPEHHTDSIDGKTSSSSDQKLESLRRQVDAIDRQIVSLLVQRQSEVEHVVALKKTHNLPVYHPAREEDMISRLRTQGSEAGLDPDYLEELYRRILRQSRVVQTAQLAQRGIRAGATVLIVGGRGGMGQYFNQWFSDAGYRVRILGRDAWPNVEKLCEGIELAMISVPIERTDGVARELGPHLPEDCILCDVTSIKVSPLSAMLESHPGPVVGLHPLFGPTTSTMDKQIIVVTPGRDQDACQWLIEQFAAWGSIILQTSPEEHDEIMSTVQTVRHFATFAFGQFLYRRGIDISRTLEFSSPIYRLELGMVGRLFAQDASLYSEIIFASPDRRELLKDYLASVEDNLEMIEGDDREAFRAEFKKVADWFGPFSEQALRESTFLIDKLIERF